MSKPIPVFGTSTRAVTYTKRPGAYAFVFDAYGRILVVHGRWGCYLPGGGSQNGEDDVACLKREVNEELGAMVTSSNFVCEGAQYVGPIEDEGAFLKKERFYNVILDCINIEPPSSHHRPEWLTIDEARVSLTEDCQRWAVSQVVTALSGK